MELVEYDLIYMRACVDLLEDYILSPEIYWHLQVKPPVGAPPFPMLTLGGIYLTKVKANCRARDQSTINQLEKVNYQIESIHRHWRVAWENKATQEFHSRLLLWQEFLKDVSDQPENNLDRYGYEVGRRVMLQLLAQDAYGAPSTEIELLKELDDKLKSIFSSGNFIWESELSGGFPADKYWYLWGTLRS